MVSVTRSQSVIQIVRGQRVPVVRQAVRRVAQVRTSRTVVLGQGAVYEHVQSSPATLWTINHLLARRPAAVAVLSPGGVEVDAAVTHINDNQLIVEFSSPQVGTVRAS